MSNPQMIILLLQDTLANLNFVKHNNYEQPSKLLFKQVIFVGYLKLPCLVPNL